jgi:hypothetical protein
MQQMLDVHVRVAPFAARGIGVGALEARQNRALCCEADTSDLSQKRRSSRAVQSSFRPQLIIEFKAKNSIRATAD